MPTIFFTADEHYDHSKILLLQTNRSSIYTSLEEMQEGLIAGHNKVVGKHDIVYHLGDFALEDPRPFLKRLNGNHVLIRGNHDHWHHNSELAKGFVSIHDVLELKMEKASFWLSHYPHLAWPRDKHGVIHLYGHCHGTLTAPGKAIDVGVDTSGLQPLSIDEVIEKAALLPLPIDRYKV